MEGSFSCVSRGGRDRRGDMAGMGTGFFGFLDIRRSKQHATTWLTQHREIYHKEDMCVDLEDVINYDISNLHWIDTYLFISELFIKQNFQHSRSPRTTP